MSKKEMGIVMWEQAKGLTLERKMMMMMMMIFVCPSVLRSKNSFPVKIEQT